MKQKSPQIRAELIRIATEKFLALGYERTTMAQISATFGGSKTTLYTHFPTKEALFLAVVEVLAKGPVEHAFAALTIEGNINQTLINFGRKYLQVTCSEKILKIFRMGIAESENSEAGYLLYAFGPKLCRQRITRYFEEKKENKIIKNCDPHLATIHYLKLIESDLVELFLLGIKDVPSKAEIENSVQSGVEIFLAAYLV